MPYTRRAALAVLSLALASGCANPGEKTHGEQQKEVLRKRWAAARANVLHSLAREQYQSGHFDNCRKTLDDALKLVPESAELHVLAARLSIEQGALDAADRALATARNLAPADPEAQYLSGVVAQRWQRYDQALAYYAAASEKAPSELAYLLAQAETLVAMNRQPDAQALLEARVVFFEHSAAIRDAVGLLLMQAGKYDKAVDMFRQASILATDDPTVREHLALAQVRADQPRDAVETLTRLLKHDRYLKRADLYVALAECHLKLARPRDARDAFETAGQLAPTDPAVWLGLGKAALELNDTRRAELALRRCLALDPASPEANLLVGYARLRQDNLKDALASFRKAAALAPADPTAHCMVGYALEKLGKPAEALPHYQRALQLKPNDDLATRLMADLQLDQ